MLEESMLSTNHIFNKYHTKVRLKHLMSYRKVENIPTNICSAKVHIPKLKQVMIGPKVIDCIFIGYANNNSAYWFLVHKSEIIDVHEGTIIE